MTTLQKRMRALCADQRGEVSAAYLFLIAMSLLVLAAVMGMVVPIRRANEMTQTVLGQNTP
jgi:uncharacterized protein (UPF0333 family)